MKNEIILYQSAELLARIEVRVEEETVWLTQAQIANLFVSSKANISEHVKHIFQTAELQKESTIRKIRTVQKEVYHFGASLKDLGKKWFAVSKLDVSSVKILDSIKGLI